MARSSDSQMEGRRQDAQREILGAGPIPWFSSSSASSVSGSRLDGLLAIVALLAVIFLPVVIWIAALNPGPVATPVMWISTVVLVAVVAVLMIRFWARRRSVAPIRPRRRRRG